MATYVESVSALLQAFDSLQEGLAALQKQLMQEAALPVWVPKGVSADRTALMEALLGRWIDEPDLEAGILCVSDNVPPLAERVNLDKEAFRAAVSDIRQVSDMKKSRIDKVIEHVWGAEKNRPEELQTALKRADLGRLDLRRTYRQVRVLPSPLESISYTWAIGHRMVEKVELQTAQEWVSALKDADTQRMATQLLGRLRPGESLARVNVLPNQLRANLRYREGTGIGRRSISVAGVMLYPGAHLPEVVWRENPGDAERPRIRRWDNSIEDEEYIPALKLRLYRSASGG